MFLARIVQFRKDAAVRQAIGATRSRIVRLWTTESVLVAAIGGVAGVLLAGLALPVLVKWLSPVIGFASIGLAPSLDVSIDIRIVAFGLAAITFVSIVAAVIPLAWWSRNDTYVTLQGAPDDRDNRLIQSVLSIFQIAISTTLLLGGALMIRTLDGLNAVDPGFDRESLVRFAFDLSLGDYDGPTAAAFRQRLLGETTNLPGVESVALTATPVMQGIGTVMVVARPGQIESDGAWNTNVNRVTSGYFETMGIELVSGMTFDDRPLSADEPERVVVNEAFVDRFFGDENPIGNVFGMGTEFVAFTYQIVGVVSDANYRSLREFNPPIFYTNLLGNSDQFVGTFNLIARAAAPELILGPVRSIVKSIDPSLPVLEAVTMSEEVERSLWRERLATNLAAGFATIGLAVATIGLYAILAQYVASRRREIGLRLALGARNLDLVRLIARRVTFVVLLGMLVGVAVHLAIGRWLSSLLYGVALLDPAAMIAAGVVLVLTSLIAGIEPLRRAISVDPMSTLRQE